ncbi:MAG: pyridoxal phosphate-dependent aminotransferase [Halioglobus sp.]
MRYSSSIKRLSQLGGDKWAIYKKARALVAEGADVIELAIGEPDVATPDYLIEAAITSLRNGRTDYSPGPGETSLRDALAKKYSAQAGRKISREQILCFPGTQTALYAAIRAVAGDGDEILIGDPMYATYEGVVASSGANIVPVALRPENGFRLQATDIEKQVTPDTSAILINTPHNPTGALLSAEEIADIGALAREHDLWLIVDEVYEELVFEGSSFATPLSQPDLADRTIVVCSISKSHAAPGFRSGWCVAPELFCEHLLPLSEAMLFGSQPFLADATELAIANPSPVAAGMRVRFATRAERLATALHANTRLKVHQPEAGMFAMIDVSASGMNGEEYAWDLLDRAGVGVMPGASFGRSLDNWIRIALTESDEKFDEGCKRIIAHANAR